VTIQRYKNIVVVSYALQVMSCIGGFQSLWSAIDVGLAHHSDFAVIAGTTIGFVNFLVFDYNARTRTNARRAIKKGQQ